MNRIKQIKYWLNSAEADLKTAENLFGTKDYNWSLFVGHLVLEKALKAFYTHSVAEVPPKTHDLIKLARKAELELSKSQVVFLSKVNDFNIEARYPDFKNSFYKVANAEFAKRNLRKIREEFEWIKSRIKLPIR